ncbi:preprotein translocase subunit SecD [Novipirellula galeiformis]|uniref:Preprotein translocase subunit SecD n=1 Tax=Novipirellula galeiformis TaxID=2528004 RepID=A0A5C6C3C6_9BACT|nr:hypothetical protein [Novipirellula galeiformis]TWU17784.1 preprotein translocase subunit SecD [Novipirellula galeiformis]
MKCMIPLALTVVLLAGCEPGTTAIPGPVPPGVIIEIYAVAAVEGLGTKAAVDPTTKATINLVGPPVVQTSDIATVAKSMIEIETVGGVEPAESVPALEIVLNPAGTKKMLAATTSPNSSTLAVLVDGQVVSVPQIFSPINGSFRVTGDHRDPSFLNAISAVTGQP